MNILELSTDSTSGINKIEEGTPLSEWAVEFIRDKSLNRETYASTNSFRNLTRRQKDAIRYQLRKRSRVTKGTENEKPPRARKLPQDAVTTKTSDIDLLAIAKIVLGFWISGFLLFDIANIYITKGATPFMAWQAAILVELCILVSSLSVKTHLRRIAFALFAYNILLFGFMELDQVTAKLSLAEKTKAKSSENEKILRTLKDQLKVQLTESTRNLARLDSDHARGFVTSGSNAFEKVSKSINSTSTLLAEQIETLDAKVQSAEAFRHGSLWIWITSLLYFLLRCLLQGFSIMLLKRER